MKLNKNKPSKINKHSNYKHSNYKNSNNKHNNKRDRQMNKLLGLLLLAGSVLTSASAIGDDTAASVKDNVKNNTTGNSQTQAIEQSEQNINSATERNALLQDDLTANQARFLLDEKPLSPINLFGDQIDPSTMVGTFSMLELDIPGNSSLPVSIKHQAKFINHDTFELPYFSRLNATVFGIPRVYGIKNSASDDYQLDRLCSADLPYNDQTRGGYTGPYIAINGVESHLFRVNSAAGFPAGTDYITKDNWLVDCISDGKGNEGFSVTLTDGSKYIFDHLMSYIDVFEKTADFQVFASRAQDRFGNWVSYKYGADTDIDVIESSDGRTIRFDYDSFTQITQITVNNQTWTFDPGPSFEAYQLTRPDGKIFSVAVKHDDGIKTTYTLTHPDGAVGTFVLQDRSICQNRIFDQDPPSDTPWWFHDCLVPSTPSSPHYPMNMRYGKGAISMVTSKTVALSTAQSYQWDYSIASGFETTAEGTVVSAANSSRTIRITSNDKIHEYTYSQVADKTSGDLIKEEIFDKTTNVKLQTKAYTYDYKTIPGYACLFSGCLTSTRTDTKVNWDRIHTNARLKLTTSTLNGDIYYTENLAYNAYDAVTAVREWHSFDNKNRYTQFGYMQDTSNWVLNLPTTTSVSADNSTFTEVDKTHYQQITATDNRFSNQWLPSQSEQFGQWVRAYKSFHDDGNIKRIELNAPLTHANATGKICFISSGYSKNHYFADTLWGGDTDFFSHS